MDGAELTPYKMQGSSHIEASFQICKKFSSRKNAITMHCKVARKHIQVARDNGSR
jgi:hypothetical protein